MVDKNYPIYIKTGFMNRKIIGNILVKEKLIKSDFYNSTYNVEYCNAQITNFFKKVFVKSWVKDGSLILSEKAKEKFVKEVNQD